MLRDVILEAKPTTGSHVLVYQTSTSQVALNKGTLDGLVHIHGGGGDKCLAYGICSCSPQTNLIPELQKVSGQTFYVYGAGISLSVFMTEEPLQMPSL